MLNEQTVFDDPVSTDHGALVGMAHDQMKNMFWVYTEYAVYKYQVNNEGRHVWKIYLEQDRAVDEPSQSFIVPRELLHI